MKKPRPIAGILEQTLKALEIDVHLKAHSIFGAWREIVGDTIARQSQPRSIRNRILFVDVSHPTWIQQLQFLKPALLEKINGFLGEPRIQDIRFRFGTIPPVAQGMASETAPQKEIVDRGTLERIDSLIQPLGDGELRRGLREVLIRSAQTERAKKGRE